MTREGMRIRDWHPAVIIALWITVLIGEWFALLVLPFSLASVVTIPLLLFTGLVVTSHWRVGRSPSARPRSSVMRRLVGAAIVIIGGGTLVAAAAAVFRYGLTAAGREIAFGPLLWSAGRIGAVIGALVLVGLVLTVGATAVRPRRPAAASREPPGDGSAAPQVGRLRP